ncbi:MULTISPECIES: DUF1302 domain-containing protein [Paraburkholderia]|uniref:DUF1302 domain-containing protein n=1 Tax=Paraburkholderia madseniana TaxID=2599607 RepID=A0AAP5BL45_9BURK|nr:MULTISPECIES: DUF1302 family protein [Paraburkholderia]MCX4149966.1 DUF1302 family protein [Paraburkholderia madseniana]MDN7152902.1 DUF1302 domain-containing protein [Paraburkholderia sp. WS6]MDQ6411784.1 DUF1302 domain-containing protein [Paraburkholderia madseniana]
MEPKPKNARGWCGGKKLAVAASMMATTGVAHAYKFTTPPEWDLNLDTSLQYTVGMRAQGRDSNIGNGPFYAEGDYKFDPGELVTNRVQGLFEFQGSYQKQAGFRVSASAWKDFAYSDSVATNPAFPPSFLTYPSGEYSGDTKRYHIEGAELLDAFVFANPRVGSVPLYFKVGRFTQQWGNALFDSFGSISYSQHPVDFIKAFTQPGSEVKELFLPRTQIMATAEVNPQFSVSAQYFFEFRGNRYPQGGTYLGAADFLGTGPQSGGALAGVAGGPVSAGNEIKPRNTNNNFGVKATWSPDWAGGDLGFYYRQFDEVQPWTLLDLNANGGGFLHESYAQNVKLLGLSFERAFGNVSTGFETSYRKDTALNSALTNGIPGVPTTAGARGDVVSAIANAFIQLGSTPLWDAGVLLAEISYTNLLKVTDNASMFNGVGYAACTTNSKWDGCATKHAVSMSISFEPQWLQAFPNINLSMPMSLSTGIYGNAAYAAGSAQGSSVYSIGVKATAPRGSTVTLQYNGYHSRANQKSNLPGVGQFYSSGNGPIALNDKGWVQLTFKTSF